MPIDLPDNFDFSNDSHKLLLISTLEKQQSAITSLRKQLELANQAREFNPLFPAELRPVVDTVGSGSTSGSLMAAGPDGVSLFGNWASNGAMDVIEPTVYQRSGSETWRPGDDYGHDSGNTLTVALYGILPQSIQGWLASGIEVDVKTGTGASSPNFAIRATFGQSSSEGLDVTVNTTTQSSSWQTLRIPGEDLDNGFARQAGTAFLLQVTLTSTGATPTHGIGSIRLNWK